MKIGLVGYQGGGKTTLFELITGTKPDIHKAHLGQVGVATFVDGRFRRLVDMYKPKKESPARLEIFDTPGLSKSDQHLNPQRFGVIRESNALVQVVGCFNGANAVQEVHQFGDDMALADLQVVSNRIDRLEKDIAKARPDRDVLKAELDALQPIHHALNEGQSLQDLQFTAEQESASRSFSLLTRKKRLVVCNTSESDFDQAILNQLASEGVKAIAAPVGLELEVAQLPPDERAVFAEEMGLKESCREKLVHAIFEVTDYITFFTSDEKEVHAWLLHRGSNAVEAAHTIHTDLARGFIRAEVMSVEDLFRLGSEREVKAHGLYRLEGKEYIVRDGDEIVIRHNA